MEKNKDKGLGFSQAFKLQGRAVKELHKLDPWLFPAMALEKIISAAIPFVLVYFSARILNELAGDRRPDILWAWVWTAVAVNGLAALLKAALTRFRTLRRRLFFDKKDALFIDKQLKMDFADVEKSATQELRSKIKQYDNFTGMGLYKVMDIFSDLVEALTGILSAILLSVSLFTARVPEGGGGLRILNSPLFILALLALLLLISGGSGLLHGQAENLFAAKSDVGTLGNRIYNFFSFLGFNQGAMDVRIYKQNAIAAHYFPGSRRENFGPEGPMAAFCNRQYSSLHGLGESVSALFTGAIYVFTCLKALGGAFGVGFITQYVGAATQLSGSLTKLFSALAELKGNGKFLALTFEYLDIPNAMYQGSLTTEKRRDRAYQVEFKDVSFKYPGTEIWALRHVNVKFQIGSRMAIVGENGSGKTTFIKLLCRLYDPQEGEILLNGINIKKYDYREYMDIFSIVFQDFQLLSQPLGNNVAGGKEYDQERVIKALEDAGFGERLKTMPEGLGTLLYRQYEDTGVEISGGEAQKIAIARALYRNAPFLVLDEPTAALDPIAEAEIYAQLNQIVEDRTAIYISHRLSSCRFCDEILVFDRGQVVQRGSHEALLGDGAGKYSALWNAQAQYYTAND